MPEGVFLNNKKYFSSRDAASYAGYTNDYVSRLCREGKVPGQMVGRTWHVEAQPFLDFLLEQEQKKVENSQMLSEERKKIYQKVVEEKEISKLSSLQIPTVTLPAIRIPRELVQKTFALSLALSLVFGTYFAKDSSYVTSSVAVARDAVASYTTDVRGNTLRLVSGIRDGVVASSIKASGLVSNVLSSVHNKNTQDVFTDKNILQHAEFFGTSINRKIDQGLLTYLSYIEKTGMRSVELGEELQKLPTTLQKNVTKESITALSQKVAQGVQSQVSQAAVYGIKEVEQTTSDLSLFVSSAPEYFKGSFTRGTRETGRIVRDTRESLAAVSIPNFFNGLATGIRSGIAGWLGVVTQEELASTTPQNVVQNVVNQPVVERVVERKETVVTGGVTESYVLTKLEQLNNKLSSEIYSLSSANATSIVNNYNTIAQTNNIDKLKGVTITSSTLNDVTIGGSSTFSGTTGSFSSELSASSFSVSGNSTLSGALIVDTSGLVYNTSSKNVGIGTTTPWARLSVAGTSNDSTTPLFAVSTSSASATSTAFYISADGKVGVGTTSPSAIFAVEGNAYINGIVTSNLSASGSVDFSGPGTTTFAGGIQVGGLQALRFIEALSFTSTSTTATSTFAGKLLAAYAPTLAHTFSSWTPGVANANPLDSSLIINPASSIADGNLITASVGGSIKFVVDAEGDVYTNSLTSVGGVTLSTTTASTFSVEGNTTLGDAITDVTTINGTLTVTGQTSVSTVAGNFGVGTTSPWARLSVSGTSNDSTTPLFSISSSTASATSTAFHITAAGLVGIGTASPAYQLDVAGTGRFTGALTAAGLSSLQNGFISQASSTVSAGGLTVVGYSTTTQALIVQGASATSTFAGGLAIETSGLVYDYSTNRVGIGTASPAYTLDVAGTGRFTGTLTVANLYSTLASSTNFYGGQQGSASAPTYSFSGSTNTGLYTSGYSSPSYLGISVGGTNVANFYGSAGVLVVPNGPIQTAVGSAGAPAFAETLAGTTGIFFPSTSNIGFSVSGSEKARLTSAGNFGIGTSSPYAKLSVVGEVVASHFTATTTATSTFGGPLASSLGDLIVSGLGTTNNVLLSPYGGKIGIGTTSPWGKLSIEMDTTNPSFVVANQGSTSPAFYVSGVNSDGVVGIGTTGGTGRRLDVFDAGNPQLRLSQTSSIYTNFQVAASTGDLTIDLNPNTTATNVYLTQTSGTTGANLRVCQGSACPSVTITSGGNILAENGFYFGNGYKLDQVAGTTTEIGVYNTAATPIIIFDEF